jgi:hypothetical protein
MEGMGIVRVATRCGDGCIVIPVAQNAIYSLLGELLCQFSETIYFPIGKGAVRDNSLARNPIHLEHFSPKLFLPTEHCVRILSNRDDADARESVAPHPSALASDAVQRKPKLSRA